MKRLVTLSLLIALPAIAADWKPVEGNLMTRWAKDVNPQCPLPEYPRPQMERKEWTNLNGLWDYAITELDAPKPEKFDGQILVPYPIESALSGVKKSITAKDRLWYRRTFAAPKLSDGKRLLLNFGAVDWEAKVFVNGKSVAEHKGGYDAFTCDITDAVKPGADNELVVSVFDATGGMQPKGKQHLPAITKPGGIMYTPCSGIWQTVWLETVPIVSIKELRIMPDPDNNQVTIVVDDRCRAHLMRGPTVKVVVSDGDKTIATGEGGAGGKISIRIPDPKLWSPDNPFLYGLKVTLSTDISTDTVTSYFGMRKVSVGKDEKGFLRLLLNNQFVLQVGFLDQGFWPDGIYTAPTDEALRFDIEITKKLGMNMARKHVKVEPDRWYYWADKLGLLIWQDMPSAHAGKGSGKDKKTGEMRDGVRNSDEDNAQFETELKALVHGLWNHPSIIMWVVFNEGWGQYETPRLTQWVKEMDPSRFVNNASGWHDIPAGDVIDMHNYPGPGCPKPDGKRAAVLGEFGGLGLPVPGHMWVDKSWGYRGMPNATALTRKYCDLLRKVYELKDSDGLNACVYTQTTDCETECNGLLTYDRELKPDLALIAAANRGIFPPPPKIETVVPTSQAEGLKWRYTETKPADDWFKSDFNDSAWKEAEAGFGNSPRGGVARTKWKSADIWVRRTFTLPAGDVDNLSLTVYHDEDADIYLNGVLAAKLKAYNDEYEPADIDPAAKKALKPGQSNVIAIHCHQTIGGQFIDAGLIRVVEQPLPAAK